MKRIIFIVCLVILSEWVSAQQMFPIYRDTTKQNDVDYFVQLNEVSIVDKKEFENYEEKYRYNQMRHYVKQILPYVDEAVRMFHEIDETTKTMRANEKRKYIRSQEKRIKVTFEDKVRKLNRTQGKYLVKAINRNLGKSCYHIVKELKNPVTAAYYRSLATMNGIDLDEDYQVENNRDFERIMDRFGY